MVSDKAARDPRPRGAHRRASAQPQLPSSGLAPAAALALPGIIGAELSQHVAEMQRVVREIRNARTISHEQLALLESSLTRAHRIAKQSQQISRLAGDRRHQAPERVGLHAIVSDVLNSQALHFRLAGYEVRHRLRAIEVIEDPGLLLSLAQVAVDWIAEQGQRLQIRLDMKNWPEHAVLILKSSAHVVTHEEQQERASPDSLNWQMLVQIAHVMEASVNRVIADDHTLLQIEFPHTVGQVDAMTAGELDGAGHLAVSRTEGKPLAGHRVLLIASDAAVCGELEAICETMGLVLNISPTTAQAVRYCEMGTPHLIVVDERLRDRNFDELRKDLIRSDINFPVVEVATASNILQMSNWMGDSVSRISQDSLRSQLPSFLAMELSRKIS